MFRKILLILSVVISTCLSASAALTAEQVAQKAAAVVANSNGLSATFTLSANGRNTKGSIKSSGSKFTVSLPEVSTWYNGKALYTYNPRIGETTVTTPTAQELLESNPLLYVKGGGAYTYKFSTVKRNGKYMVELTPRNATGGVKKLVFTINSSNFHIEKIVVTTTGGITTISIGTLSPGVKISPSEFEYPKGKYPKAEIVDLR